MARSTITHRGGAVSSPRASSTATVIDLVLAGAVAGIGAVMAYVATVTQGYGLPLVASGLAIAEGVPLLWRRRAPVWVLSATVAVFLIGAGVTGIAATPMLGPLIAAYSVGACRSRRVAAAASLTSAVAAPVIGLGLLGAAFPLTVSLTAEPASLADALLGSLVGFSGAALLGAYIGTRRAYQAELAERAERLEREQQAQAERAVVEERARIARELHDVAAHHLSGIALQASALDRTVDRDPSEARALAHDIRQESSTALSAMRRLVDILRADDADGRTPQPGLEDVPELVDRARRDGANVQLRFDVAQREVPREVGLGAYRVLQESLTNVRRHADGAQAVIEVRDGDDRLELHVCDDGGAQHPSSPASATIGHGLRGMQERVELLGGTFAAGPRATTPGWCVRAELPYDRQDAR